MKGHTKCTSCPLLEIFFVFLRTIGKQKKTENVLELREEIIAKLKSFYHNLNQTLLNEFFLIVALFDLNKSFLLCIEKKIARNENFNF